LFLIIVFQILKYELISELRNMKYKINQFNKIKHIKECFCVMCRITGNKIKELKAFLNENSFLQTQRQLLIK